MEMADIDGASDEGLKSPGRRILDSGRFFRWSIGFPPVNDSRVLQFFQILISAQGFELNVAIGSNFQPNTSLNLASLLSTPDPFATSFSQQRSIAPTISKIEPPHVFFHAEPVRALAEVTEQRTNHLSFRQHFVNALFQASNPRKCPRHGTNILIKGVPIYMTYIRAPLSLDSEHEAIFVWQNPAWCDWSRLNLSSSGYD